MDTRKNIKLKIRVLNTIILSDNASSIQVHTAVTELYKLDKGVCKKTVAVYLLKNSKNDHEFNKELNYYLTAV